ncbi:sialin-like [Argiope bruennichi]|uniref:sialin-like n=1 Tax=Argiope bruennichi TaxID=94029 RepID=UPI002493ECAE|nr:sialin-like [Argiope bruennichi]
MVNQTEPNLSNGKYFAATTCPENEETKNASWKKREGKFLWDSKEQGLILGIGFFGFSLAAIPVSRLVRTFQARRVTLFGSLLSSVTTLLCPVASEFHVNAMIVVQFIRGIGQGLLFLSLFALMANWFHPNERGLLSTIVISGYSIGSMFAAAISGFICDTPELGWPAVFYVIGGIGVFQAILVIALLHETPQEHPKISLDELLYLTDDEKKSASNKVRDF